MRYPLSIWCAWVAWIHVLVSVADSEYGNQTGIPAPPPIAVSVQAANGARGEDSPDRLEIRVSADRPCAEDFGIPVDVLLQDDRANRSGGLPVASTTVRMVANHTSATATIEISRGGWNGRELRLMVSPQTSRFVEMASITPLEVPWNPPPNSLDGSPPPEPAPVISWVQSEVSVSEGAGYVEVPFTVSRRPAVDIRYQITGEGDANRPGRSVTLGAGRLRPDEVTGDAIKIPVRDDAWYEPDGERYVLTLLECPGLHMHQSRMTLTVVDDESPPLVPLRLSAASVREGTEQPVELTALASVASVLPIEVEYQCAPESTALPETDFEVLDAEFGRITIPAGEMEASVLLRIRDDSYYNGARTAVFRIAGSESSDDASSVSLVIEDDEAMPMLALRTTRSEPKQPAAVPADGGDRAASQSSAGGSFGFAADADLAATVPIRIHYELPELGSLTADEFQGPAGFDPATRTGVLEIPAKSLKGEVKFRAGAEAISFHTLQDGSEQDGSLVMRITRLENARLAPLAPKEFSWSIEDSSLKAGDVVLILLVTDPLRGKTFRAAVASEIDGFVSRHKTRLLDGRALLVTAKSEELEWPAAWDGKTDPGWDEADFLPIEPLSNAFSAAQRWIPASLKQAKQGDKLKFIIVWPCEWDTADLPPGDKPHALPAGTEVRLVWLGAPENVGRRSKILDDWFGPDNWEPLREPAGRLSIILEKYVPALMETAP